MQGQPCFINGDGKTTRDFCYVANAVQANILAGIAEKKISGEVLNIGIGTSSTLSELFTTIRDEIGHHKSEPSLREFREGDVRHSLADISKAKKLIFYEPTHKLQEGIRETVAWFKTQHHLIK